MMRNNEVTMSETKFRTMLSNANLVSYWRRNPCIAARDLLGINLTDSQKYIMQRTWNTPHCVWCCSRNFGKSFVGAVFMILKALLYENQAIYIISSVGDQAKETFEKIEQLVTGIGGAAASFKNLKDIAAKETKKSPSNKDGFSHNPASYEVSFYNGSTINTLNSKPDSVRSRRATLVFFDEAAFCNDELIIAAEAFATQNTDFVTSTDKNYRPELEALKVPTQLIYASSQDDIDTLFYRHYKEFAKKMLAGDRNYFVCDMICDVAINVYMDGKPYTPLLSQSKVDAALAADPDKARREYYNQPMLTGGANQIIKKETIRRNEKLIIPYAEWRSDNKIVIAFDPARTGDNSIVSVMNIYKDPVMGWCGNLINCQNLVDVATKQKYKLNSKRQLDYLRELVSEYNGDALDYEYIHRIVIDAGAGGGGVTAYADNLLDTWIDSYGRYHKGMVDSTYDLYETYDKKECVDIVSLISPRKYRTIMVEEFIELMNLGVIHFPFEYKGTDYLRISTGVDSQGEETHELYYLSDEEKIALTQLDMMKREILMIQKSTNPEKTSVTYALPKEREGKAHDDRFYTVIMLAHVLYQLRRGSDYGRKKSTLSISDVVTMRAPKNI